MPLDVYTGSIRTPITVIQAAYREYCAPAKDPAINYVLSCFLAFEDVIAETQAPQYVHVPSSESWLKFQQLVISWREQRGVMSSTTEAAMSPAYQGIIGMGKEAVPLILKQMESEGDDPDQWFWALTSITGATPERAEDQGNYAKMAASWFEWARNIGYAW
jgi:hypothetical protein